MFGAFVHAEAVRSITQQRQSLDELRSRSSFLIASANVSTAVLGSQAAKGIGQRFPLEYLWAVIPFVLLMILSLAILWPRRGWVFTMKTQDFTNAVPAGSTRPSAEQTALSTAEFLEARETDNDRMLRKRFLAFQFAAFLLLWEIVAWVVIIL